MIEVRFSKKLPSVTQSWVSSVVHHTLKTEKSKRCSVSVLLTDNRKIRQINKKFLKHDYATDVISFGAGPGPESDYLGDLVVSVDMAKSFSKELKISFKEELARYLIHGTLHLLGYDDQKPADKKKMFSRQELILSKIYG